MLWHTAIRVLLAGGGSPAAKWSNRIATTMTLDESDSAYDAAGARGPGRKGLSVPPPRATFAEASPADLDDFRWLGGRVVELVQQHHRE